MFKRTTYTAVVLLVGIVLGSVLQPFKALESLAQPGCVVFKETGKVVCGQFLIYWNGHGGLAQQGYPISGEFAEVSPLNGQTYTVQYFERAVFEKHPENKPPYDVLLSQLGTFQFKAKYPNGDPSGSVTPVPQPTSKPPSQGIIGQVVKYSLFGSGKNIIQATVTDAKEAASIPAGSIYPEIKAKGKFVLVFADVVNLGTESSSAYYGAKLKDSKGRTFDIGDTQPSRNAAEQYNVDPAMDTLQPGIPSKTVFVFDVAVDATAYLLVGDK